MKTLFDKPTRELLIARTRTLNENSRAQWGKMNVYQMLKHCTLWHEWMAGKRDSKQVFLGRLFGRMALKDFIKDESPMRRNAPTIPELRIGRIGNHGDVAYEKAKLIALIEGFEHFSNPRFVHSFFGKMTDEQIGYMAYKHYDHHLRQFGA